MWKKAQLIWSLFCRTRVVISLAGDFRLQETMASAIAQTVTIHAVGESALETS
jgi:hypothetical protein